MAEVTVTTTDELIQAVAANATPINLNAATFDLKDGVSEEAATDIVIDYDCIINNIYGSDVTIDGVATYNVQFDGCTFTVNGKIGSRIIFTRGDTETVRVLATSAAIIGVFNYCTFSESTAGSDIAIYGVIAAIADVTCNNCIAKDGSNDGFSLGSSATGESATMTLNDCESSGHSGLNDDGATAHSGNQILIVNGGSYHDNVNGISCTGAAGVGPTVTVMNNAVFYNTKYALKFGGDNVTPITISDVSIYGISADGRAFYAEGQGTWSFNNVIMEGNAAARTAFFCTGVGPATVSLTNCIVYNFTNSTYGNGVELGNAGRVFNIDHCVFYNNDFHVYRRGANDLITNSILMNGIDAVNGAIKSTSANSYRDNADCGYNIISTNALNFNNDDSNSKDLPLDLDPKFVDAANGDFNLDYTSPCIRAGSDGTDIGAIPYNSTRDLILEGETVSVTSDSSYRFYSETGETATVIINGISYLINEINSKFIWDYHGEGFHSFNFTDDYVVRNAAGQFFEVIWDGVGSQLFTINFLPSQQFDGPSLTSPNGGEVFSTKEITINWTEPTNIESTGNLVWYEILFTEFYGKFEKPEWIQIANVSIGTTSFIWSVSQYIKSDMCRIGVRAVNHRGERSKISFSAANFSIEDKKLPIPAVFEPVEQGSYFASVPFIFDNKGIINQCSQRAFYQVYYSSKSLDIDWTLLFSDIPVGSDPLFWDIKNVITSQDYSFKIELIDKQYISDPIFINNVSINSLNYFTIDTQPPKGNISIVNNREYIKDKDIVVNVTSYDETTGVEFFRIEQKDINSEDEIEPGPYQKMSNLSTWHIAGINGEEAADGIKLIQVRFKDFAGNVLLDGSEKEFFRTYKSLDNEEITSFLGYSDGTILNLWTAFGGSSPQLYNNQSFVSNLDGEVTSLIFYNNILYIAIKDSDNNGILQRYSGGIVETLISIPGPDSVVNSMEVFDDRIFIGLQNGKLLSFNGISISEQHIDNSFMSSINYLKTDDKVLYIFIDNTLDILIMIGSNGQYEFRTVSMEQ